MSSAKKKKDSNQPELPIEGAPSLAPAETKPASGSNKATATDGNGETHVMAEQVEAIAHRPCNPKKLEAGLHRRVDRGFLDYGSYVSRDRGMPDLAGGLQP